MSTPLPKDWDTYSDTEKNLWSHGFGPDSHVMWFGDNPWQKRKDRLAREELGRPPTPPDLTDKALQTKRQSALMLAGAGQGRRSTFLTSTMGEPLLGKTLLGGGA